MMIRHAETRLAGDWRAKEGPGGAKLVGARPGRAGLGTARRGEAWRGGAGRGYTPGEQSPGRFHSRNKQQNQHTT